MRNLQSSLKLRPEKRDDDLLFVSDYNCSDNENYYSEDA